ncbi:MAG TPA: hypothetical protein VEW69_05075 [Alphaproteobacteria bacterium]|nr:hypothetical protein [Alphaproteobacteria bacterium]
MKKISLSGVIVGLVLGLIVSLWFGSWFVWLTIGLVAGVMIASTRRRSLRGPAVRTELRS